MVHVETLDLLQHPEPSAMNKVKAMHSALDEVWAERSRLIDRITLALEGGAQDVTDNDP